MDQRKVAADSDRRLSVVKGELETAQAEYAEGSQAEGRLDTAHKNFKARCGAQVCPSPAACNPHLLWPGSPALVVSPVSGCA